MKYLYIPVFALLIVFASCHSLKKMPGKKHLDVWDMYGDTKTYESYYYNERIKAYAKYMAAPSKTAAKKSAPKRKVAGMVTAAPPPPAPVAKPNRAPAGGSANPNGTEEGRPGIGEPGETTGTPGVTLPVFPWPPPKPSAVYDLPHEYFEKCITFGDAANKIIRALDRSGYSMRSYYAIPGGFAIATQLEQMSADGTPKPEPNRWNPEYVKLKVSSVSDYISALFKAPPGYYRCIVFFITKVSYNMSADAPADKEVEKYVYSGNNKLPDNIAGMKLTKDYTYSAFIYQVEKRENKAAKMVVPSALSGKTHLTKNRLLSNITQ